MHNNIIMLCMVIPCQAIVLNIIIIMQVYFVLQNELLQAGTLELDTPSLFLIHSWYYLHSSLKPSTGK